MGAPPVPTEQHSRIIRARRVVAAAEQAARAERTEAARRPGDADLPKTVANVTDPQSRVMPTRRGFLQGYNAQVAVTSDHLIAAVHLGQSPNDMSSFVPMMKAAIDAAAALHHATALPEHQVGVVLADAGYCSNRNLAAPGPDRLIALSKSRDQAATAQRDPMTGPPPPDASARQAMNHRLRTPEGARLYKRRGATVEPSIGNLKMILPRFSRRGLDAAASELNLAATAFNLMKIHHAAPTA
jgi:hypothetical protein